MKAGEGKVVVSKATQAHELQAQVLRLPPEERAQMLELLNASFEPKSKVQEGCQALSASRKEDIRSGKFSMVLEVKHLSE